MSKGGSGVSGVVAFPLFFLEELRDDLGGAALGDIRTGE